MAGPERSSAAAATALTKTNFIFVSFYYFAVDFAKLVMTTFEHGKQCVTVK